MSSTRTAHDRREQARIAEEQARASQARRARLAVAGALALVAATVLALVVAQNRDDGPDGATVTRSGGLLTSPPPWPAQAEGLTERVAALDFPPVGDESYHAHALLTVYRDGAQVPVA